MENETDLKTYRTLLTQRNGKGFSEAEVTNFLQQILPQLEAHHDQEDLQGTLSLDTLAIKHDRVIWLSDFSFSSQSSITRYIYDLGLCAIELLTAKHLSELRNPDGIWNWENYCFVSTELAQTIERMLKDFPEHRFQSAIEVLSALNNSTIPAANLFSTPSIPLPPSLDYVTNDNSSSNEKLELVEQLSPGVSTNSTFTLPETEQNRPGFTTPARHLNSRLAIWQLGLISLASMVTVVASGLGIWKGLQPNAAIFSYFNATKLPATSNSNNPLFAIQKDGKRGYIDKAGKVVIKPSLNMNLAISENSVVDIDGKCSSNEFSDFIKVPPQYKKSDHFQEDRIPIEVNDKCGFINSQGKVVILPKFDDASFFSEGLAAVKIGGKYGYIDQNGKVVINTQFTLASSFSAGLATVKIGNKFGYIDRSGQFVINPQFEWAGDFSDDLATVKVGDKYGYIDRTGRMLIDPKFSSYWHFSEGLGTVKIDEKVGYIDKTDKFIIEPQFYRVFPFSEGVAAVCTESNGNNCGFIDRTGKFVINPQFTYISYFSEGLAAVSIDNQWGYIDKFGRFVVNPQFDWAGDFNTGLALVKVGDKWGYIDKNGKFIWQPSI
jgi:WG containing repeat